jgi:hypothetical protein
VENRTGHDVDLHLYLCLVDAKGAVVGYAFAWVGPLERDEERDFEALPGPGPPEFFKVPFLAPPPPFSRVERGFVYDPGSLAFLVAACCWLATHPQSDGS